MSEMESELRCYHHPDREATSQCDRCGDYLCGECMKEHRKQYLCDRCLRDVTRPQVPTIGKRVCVAIPALFVLHILVFGLGGELLESRLNKWLLFWMPIVAGLFLWTALRARRAARVESGPVKLFLSATALAAFCYVIMFTNAFVMAGLEELRAGRWNAIRISDWSILVASLVAGVIMVLAVVNWFRAVRQGIRPLWTLIILLLMMLMGLFLSGVGVYVVLVEEWGLFQRGDSWLPQ